MTRVTERRFSCRVAGGRFARGLSARDAAATLRRRRGARRAGIRGC